MQSQFQNILEYVQDGKPAALTLEADGVVYIRNFRPAERLILLGGGHIAQPLCRYGADLGFAVTVVDDRPSFSARTRFPEAREVICDAFPSALQRLCLQEQDYVAVITRGHRHDADCLRAILPGPLPRYLGVIGSRRRVAGLLRLLEDTGFSRALLDTIHAPIGLPINALTPKEIAVSIVAELIQCRRQSTARGSGNMNLAAEDIDWPLLEFLARNQTPKALLTVLETSGSTPVKSGAMMAVDRGFQTAGTIGGGCGEGMILRKAHQMIGTGTQCCVTVDMCGDMEEEEGMVCGGQMKVLIKDVGK